MDWDALQAFLAVARTGRVSAAARRLNVQHTTIARRISTLETELGVPLFYRTNTGYTLTPHGQTALGPAETMEHAALALAARTRESSGVVAGRVRIAMAPEFASHWFVPRMDVFHARHPQIDIHVLVGTRERDLTRGEAELAIQSQRPRQRGLVAVRLARVAMRLYVAERLWQPARRRVTDVDTLCRLPLLTFTSSFGMLQDAKWFQPLLTNARIVMQTNSTHALMAAAHAGLGVAVLPNFVARSHPDLVDVSDDVAAHDMWLIAHPEFRRDPKVRAVAAFLREIGTELGDPAAG